MAYEQRDNSGVLFKNDKKQKENQPAYRGEGKIGGIPMWISAWVKVGKSGGKFMSLAFTRKDAPKAAKSTPQTPPPEETDDNHPEDAPW